MNFVVQRLPDRCWIRILTVVDQFTRECLVLHADNTLSGEKVALALDKVVACASESITVDDGAEFTSKVLDLWAYTNGVHLDFIRPGEPVVNGYIESFNGKLRDECLNVEVFFALADMRIGKDSRNVWKRKLFGFSRGRSKDAGSRAGSEVSRCL